MASAKTSPTPKRRKAAPEPGAVQGGHVAIVGGGIAGLTAAIKLLKAGFKVTIFERHDRLGGNTSSDLVNGIEHDVYPHMLCDWYVNFWDLFEQDLGLSREAHFEPRAGVKMRGLGQIDYKELRNPTSMDAIVRNLKSGAMSPAEMFLMGYSMVDLAGYPFNREGYNQLDKLSVNGFLYSQSTSTEDVAELENYIMQVIWSIQSEHTSAVTYQDFIRHTLTFPDGAPFAWMLKDSLQTGLIGPIEALLGKLGATIVTGATIEAVRLEGQKPKLWWRKTGATGKAQSGLFDQAVIAVPHGPLTDLVMGGDDPAFTGTRIIDREPSLSQVRRLRSVPIPVIDLYLKRKLPDFPAENIGLTAAKFGLSVVDISQLWLSGDFGGNTALVIAASDGESLPGHDFAAQAWTMLRELVKYYPEINIGQHWGDPDCDVDWGKTHARANSDYALFLNDVGCWDWMPDTAYPGMPNIAFAGDLCRGNVNMATVEGAVESGILAAAAVQGADAREQGKQRGAPIVIRKHITYGDTALRAAKLALMPFAYGAKAATLIGQPDQGPPRLKAFGNALQSEHIALLPMQYAVDWWTTAYWFWHAALSKDEGDTPDGPSNHSDDQAIGLGAAMLMVLGELACYASEQVEHCLSGSSGDPPDPAQPYKRRWHPKR